MPARGHSRPPEGISRPPEGISRPPEGIVVSRPPEDTILSRPPQGSGHNIITDSCIDGGSTPVTLVSSKSPVPRLRAKIRVSLGGDRAGLVAGLSLSGQCCTDSHLLFRCFVFFFSGQRSAGRAAQQQRSSATVDMPTKASTTTCALLFMIAA